MNQIDFTNREKLTKSLKLELQPEDATKRAIKTQGLMEANSAVLENAKKLEYYIDIVIKDIITKGLEHLSFDMDAIYESYVNRLTNIKEYEEKKNELIDATTSCVSNYLPKGIKKLEDINSANFLKEILPSVLQNSNISEKEKENGLHLIEKMSSCGSLMEKFLITRVATVSTIMPKRVVENFEIYAENISHIKTFLDSSYAKDFLIDFPELTSMSSASYYEFCATPDGITGYNQVISGINNKNGIVTKGYNGYINELNIAHKHDPEYNGTFFRTIKPLHQQILMPKEKQFTIGKITNDEELCSLLKETIEYAPKKALFDIVEHMKTADVNSIVIDGEQLHQLSHLVYDNHAIINDKIKVILSAEIENEMTKTTKKSEIRNLENRLESLTTTIGKSVYTIKQVQEMTDDKELYKKYIAAISSLYKSVVNQTENLKEENILDGRKVFGRAKAKIVVKNYLDSLIAFRTATSIIIPKKENDLQDVFFYEKLESLREPLSCYTRAYNLCRNYLTSKPKDIATEHIMCFGQALQMQNSWWKESEPKIKAGKCALLEKDGKYYYITKSPLAKPIEIMTTSEPTGYRMLSYFKGQDASKLFAKITFCKAVKDAFNSTSVEKVENPLVPGLIITREQYNYYMSKTYALDSVRKGKTTEDERKHALTVIIDLYKEMSFLYEFTACFDYKFKETEEYNDIGLFMEDANRCMTKASWVNIDKTQMDEAIENGVLLSFLITNRNMYQDNNVKTTYARTFLHMISPENLENMNFKLNANPTVTFRPACIPMDITHPKGSILVNKMDSLNRKIPGNAYVELLDYYNNRKNKESLSKSALEYLPYCVTKVADYDIAKNYRYMVDKFFISFSYGINTATVSDRARNTISEEVYENIKNGYKVVSVVRGTTDMLYYILYDEFGNILEKRSLNKINGVDFQEKLRVLDRERKEEMTDKWNSDITVTNIKHSYVNFAIAEIMKVAVKNNAIILIEKLDENFKNKMALIDNQVYKIFETTLKNRLLDYRTKDITMGQPGSISNPMQLGKVTLGEPIQNGILFRMNGSYTKNMDSTTGFVNLFNFNNVNTVAAKRKFLSQFTSIKINGTMVEFSFDYKNFSIRNTIKKDELKKTEWVVYAGKPKTYYDSVKSCYVMNKCPAMDVITLFESASQELTKKELSNAQVKALYELFVQTIKQTTVKKCKGNEMEYYSSPVLPDDAIKLSVSENTARCLANKFSYHLQRAEDDSDYTTEWLNYAQM